MSEKELSTSHYDGLEIAGERIDPMWVYYKFQLHKLDETGALFHVLKTVLRFGKKNSIKRELQAIIASAQRALDLLEQ